MGVVMKKLLLYVLLSLFIVFITSCKDDEVQEIIETIESAEDNALAENEFCSIFDYVNSEGTDNSVIYGSVSKDPDIQEANKLLPECATVTVDTNTRTITIDFGDVNCLCLDGRYRRGKIIAIFTGKFREVGSSVSVTVEDYYLNDWAITGTKTITKAEEYKWNINVQNASITTEYGTISWSSNWNIERTEGNGTLNIFDDVYMYTGGASGVNRKGINYTVTIDQPLKKEISIGCWKNFTAGIWTLQNEGGGTMILNYDPIGGEPCDKIAEVTINGRTKRIILR